ncbi:MAG: DNA cytosine methyltransferase [Okeania sp. SIO2H7]|nr:DNA cytosine methyltransferase [Okeania sp. SIO2H7]
MLKQLDLYSGVGVGFLLAGAALGFRLICFAETDKYCRGILGKRFGTPIYGDVNTVFWESLNKPDIITASPPCQPFSICGRRGGASDDRDCFSAVFRAILHSFAPLRLQTNSPIL